MEHAQAGFLLHRQTCPFFRSYSVSSTRSSGGARNDSLCPKPSAMLGRVHDKCRQRAIVARSASRSRSRGGMVMIDSTDMSAPVTRGELRAELAEFEIRFDQKIAQLATKAELAQLATKAESAHLATQAEIAQLATKAEIAQLATKAEIAQFATKAELETWGRTLLARFDSSEQRLLAELARHTRASAEDLSAQISIIDEKYADLPTRVDRLEAKVLRTKGR